MKDIDTYREMAGLAVLISRREGATEERERIRNAQCQAIKRLQAEVDHPGATGISREVAVETIRQVIRAINRATRKPKPTTHKEKR
jgi:hypothetical protein